MRIRIIKTTTSFKKGDIVDVSPNVAFGLIDSGAGVASKELTERDIRTKNGNTPQLRPHRSSKR